MLSPLLLLLPSLPMRSLPMRSLPTRSLLLLLSLPTLSLLLLARQCTLSLSILSLCMLSPLLCRPCTIPIPILIPIVRRTLRLPMLLSLRILSPCTLHQAKSLRSEPHNAPKLCDALIIIMIIIITTIKVDKSSDFDFFCLVPLFVEQRSKLNA